MLKRLSFILVVMAAMQLLFAAGGMAAALTPEQLKMIQGLTAEQKAAIAAAAGEQPKREQPVAPPPVIKPRAVGETSLERGVQQPGADKRASEAAAAGSASASVPLARLPGQQGAESLELRRAFADFVRESKPLSVSTDLRQYGYELFAGVPTTFAPATDVPVPAEYVLGPGDELNVQLFGKLDREFAMVVDREGAVNFPEIGPLVVAGMGFAEARAYIAGQIKEKMIGVSVSITMGKLRSIRIFALGDVERPGSYTVSGLATLSHALFVSGGIRKIGSLRSIQLKRQGRLVTTLDLYDFLLRGDTSADVRLLPGDVVFVPPIGKTAAIAGEVVRPAIYELKQERTLGAALKLAGGLRPTAYRDHTLIERVGDDGERNVLEVALAGKGLKSRLADGDVIKVFSVLDMEQNPVMLLGNVKRPGKYAWREEMRLSSLLPSQDVLLPETYVDYGLIEREAEGNREPELIRFSLSAVWAHQGGDADLRLKARDHVYVFHRAHFREKPMLSIGGSVQSPGKYELKKSMRLVDLILAAGGLTRDAYRDEAELYRTDPQNKEIHVSNYSLARALAGDDEHNPELQDMDRLVVHSIWENKRRHMVAVVGEVRDPGEFELAEGMRISDLVFAAGNVTEKAYLKQAEITRYNIVDGERRESTHIQVDLETALGGDEEVDMTLAPYDVLAVRRLSNWRPVEQVSVEGEISYPGSYPVEEGEKLSSVLKRAGGYTDKAYLSAAVFTRASIRAEQQKQLHEMADRIEGEIAQMEASITGIRDANLVQNKLNSLASAKRVLQQMRSVKAAGRLVIRLDDIEKLQDGDFDLTLRDGDRLYVPQKPDQVLVIGQVYNGNALIHRRNMDRGGYIDLAGGVTRFADKGRIYVVRANGEVDPGRGWSSKRIDPGDVIVVPEDLDRFNLLDSALDWSKVLMQVGISVAAMNAIGVF